MKKTLLIICMLLHQLVIAGPRPGSNWQLFETGRYYCTRIGAFEKGLQELEHATYKMAAKQFRSSLTCTHRFNYPAYNNYAVAAAQLKKYRQAEGLFLKSEKSGSNENTVDYNIFVCRLNQKKYPAADEYFVLLPEFIKTAHPEESANYLANSGQAEAAYPYFVSLLNDSNANVAPESFFNACLSAWAVHDTDLAITSINSAIDARPKQAKFHLQKAKMYLGMDAEVSVRAFKKTLQLEPANMEARLGYVRALLCKGDGRLALDIITHTLEEKKGKLDADWYQLMAIAYAQTGEMAKALECMDQVNKLRTPTAFDHKVMGDLCLNTDSLDKAAAHYQLALNDSFIADAKIGLAIVAFLEDRMDDAETILWNLHTEHPGYAFTSYAYYLESMVYYAKGNYPGFEMTIEKAGYTKNRESSKLLIQAMKCFSHFEYSQAEKLLKKALRLEPLNLNLQLAMGSLHYQLGEYASALQTFRKALELDPANIEIKNMTALCLAKTGAFNQSVLTMMEVLAVKPKARYYNNMAMIYAMVEVADGSEQKAYCGYYETALQYLDSAFVAGLDPVFELNRANIQLSLTDTALAKKLMQEMNHSFSINNLAVLTYLEGGFQQADQYIRKAIESCPFNVPAILSYNESIIGKQSWTGEKVHYIYLYQFLPAVLPSRHQLGYTFQMSSESPLHVDGKFIVYKDLNGKEDKTQSLVASR